MSIWEWLQSIPGRRKPVPPPVPVPPTPPPAGDVIAQLLAAHNAARMAKGVPPLALNSLLCASAQGWAAGMAATGRLDHFGPGGSSPWSRMIAAGYHSSAASENIAEGQTTAQEVTADWLSDPPHAANVLGRQWVDVGFGVAPSASGVWFWVADYGGGER